MTGQQREIINEVWRNLEELAGDIIAIQNFLECKTDCIENIGPEICAAYLRRISDYADQHIHELKQLKNLLIIPELRRVCPESST